MAFDWNLIYPVLVGIGRSFLGWLSGGVLTDGKIDSFEWKQLGTTVIRYIVIATGITGVMELTTGQVDLLAISLSSVAVDYVFRFIDKLVHPVPVATAAKK
jgi:hypothetical protein